jgi:hypothetical protein
MTVGCGIEHHLDHAFDVPIHRGQRADGHAQSARAKKLHVVQNSGETTTCFSAPASLTQCGSSKCGEQNDQSTHHR